MVQQIDLCVVITANDEAWVEHIRNQALQLFALHDRKLDTYFQYAMMSASFLYGTGTLAVVSRLPDSQSASLWLAFLTLGVLAITFSFAMASAYAYQWFDRARVLLMIVETFYDEQKGDRTKTPTVWRTIRKDSYWDKKFRASLRPQNRDQEIFIEKDGAWYIDWMKAIGQLASQPHPLLTVKEAFGRVISMMRRPYPFVMYAIASVSLGVSYSLGLGEHTTLALFFVALSIFYTAAEYRMYVLYGRPRGARQVPIYR